jgi:hypothetical protein
VGGVIEVQRQPRRGLQEVPRRQDFDVGRLEQLRGELSMLRGQLAPARLLLRFAYTG